MIRFAAGAIIGAVLVFSTAEDKCDTRIKALFTADNYKAMQPVPLQRMK